MIPIQELIHKIKWDKREHPTETVLIYIDMGKPKELAYTDIKRIEGTYMIVNQNGEEVDIPLHRVRQVKVKGAIVWERKK